MADDFTNPDAPPAMPTVQRIKAAVADARQHGRHPRRLHLTLDDARKLQYELVTGDRRLGHRIEKEGFHHAVKKIEGLEVIWRSPEFKVD